MKSLLPYALIFLTLSAFVDDYWSRSANTPSDRATSLYSQNNEYTCGGLSCQHKRPTESDDFLTGPSGAPVLACWTLLPRLARYAGVSAAMPHGHHPLCLLMSCRR